MRQIPISMARRKTGTSLQDIANELDISRNAVSLALAGKPGISDALRQRIFDSAQRMQYQVKPRSTVPSSLNFLVLVPEFLSGENTFYTHIFSGIEQGLKAAGHHLMFASIPPSQYERSLLPPIFQSIQFAGILLIGALPLGYVKKIEGLSLPVVLVDHQLDGHPSHAVCITNSHGAHGLTQHLIEQGHRSIGFIGPINLTPGFYDRWVGYCRALEQAGIERNTAMEITESWPIDAMDDRALIRTALQALPKLPQAFVCLTDLIALSVMAVLREMGLRIPEDISITGFDDIQAAHLVVPALTTYRVPRIEMGREAARYICQLIKDPNLAPSQRSLYGSLQVRETVSSSIQHKEPPWTTGN